MKRRLFFLLILLPILNFSQKNYQSQEIFFQNNHAFLVDNNILVTDFVEFRDKKNIIFLKEEYLEGNLIKKFEYFNVRKMNYKEVIAREIVYRNGIKFSEVFYRSTGEKYAYVEYDEKNKKKFNEEYKDGKTILTQNFKNGKLDGKVSCYDKDGNFQEHFYQKGKLLR